MSKAMMNELTLILLANQMLHIFGKITVLRGAPSNYYKTRTLICLSEDDDGGALVWNSNLIWKYPSYAFTDRIGDMQFHDINGSNNDKIDCKMNAYEACLSSWNFTINSWTLTNSVNTPMGPVFDQRWEEFKEYKNFEDIYDNVQLENNAAMALSFSVRVGRDMHILLCDGEYYNTDSCYWVILGGWGNTKSVIRKCVEGVPRPGLFPARNSICSHQQAYRDHKPLSEIEWRSFVIKWNSVTRSISVYDTYNFIMSYVDKQNIRNRKRSNDGFRIFIRSPTAMLFRFHIYDFLYTTVQDAILTSPAFQLDNGTLCVRMLIGLCEKCDAQVMLRDYTSYEILERLTARGLSTSHGLPMWQSVKIETDKPTIGYRKVIIQVIPKVYSPSINPLWAIANVQQCPRSGFFRQGIMTARQDYDKNYFWPNVVCQKLSYNNTVVSSISSVRFNMKLDNANCPEGYIGPQCSISCSNLLESDNNCRETAICYESGCTCPPGLTKSSCSELCKWGTYGYSCKEKCGSCLYGSSCNKVTGACSGCENKEKVYIPPLCKTVLEKPDTPLITSTHTSIQAVVSVAWKDEYEQAGLTYSFSIKNQNGELTKEPLRTIFRNMTTLIGHFEGLQPGKTYQIMCSLFIQHLQVDSDWQTAETDCNPAEYFVVTSEENSLSIDWHINAAVDIALISCLNSGFNKCIKLYSCPADWYNLVVRNIDKDENFVNELVLHFPYNLIRLTPYTSYEVKLLHRHKNLFSKEIRTLEGVPSKVQDLRPISSLDTLNLMWTAPKETNGKIVRYEIILKVLEYHGCKKNNLPTPTDHIITESTTDTRITIPKLHPYASYNVQVIAHNSRHASMAMETTFEVEKTVIPAEKFSQLNVQDWKLSWSQPEDCTTILGPIIAKIKIRGISDAVKGNPEEVKQTSLNYLDLFKIESLNGAERYLAKVYAIRDFKCLENASAYEEIEFETPPKAPPKVTNLEVVEVDTRQIGKPAAIQLRWQSPPPPLNGKLRVYSVDVCPEGYYTREYCRSTNVQLNEYCDLWDNYICKIIIPDYMPSIINVVAYNMNVSESSSHASVTNKMLSNTVPEPPGNYTFTINDNSVVDLHWLHPWRTGNRLEYFRIEIQEISSHLRRRVSRSSAETNVRKYSVKDYSRSYSERLYLLSSTHYNISIQAVTIKLFASNIKFVEFRTPSTVNFNGDLQAMAHDGTVSLNIPPVLNDTRDSVMHVIVKGPNPCKEYTKLSAILIAQAGVKMYDIVWKAAEVPTTQFAGKVFTVGDNKVYGNATNCPLKSGELYEVVVIITDGSSPSEQIMLTRRASIRIGEVPPRHHEAWLIPIILFLVVAVGVFYFYRRRKQNSIVQLMLQDEMALSQNIENYENDMKSVISNSRQNMSTPSDRQSLSRATTPEVPPISIKNEEKEEEIMSLVKVKDFEDYVRQAIQSGLLEKQYETFQRGQTRSWDYGKLQQNKSKNRYGNLIAYDDTRVILTKISNDSHSDYINANYITGYKKEKRYIATQGPKPNTVVDFWRMIWQEKVVIICMLANVIENGKTKCEQYWPDIGKKKKYGDIIVLNAKHNVFADYCFRTLHITCGEETRKVEHLHYTAWPDHGVPLYTHSVVTYLKKLLATPPGNGPVVVHCSAGVGRTGTIILCDICLHRAAAEGVVDVFAETASIRNERANMVDNKQQYLLAHLALMECLLSIPTTLPCNETLPTRIKELKKQLPVQQQRLQNTAWQDEALRQVTSPPSLSERNRVKNRFPDLISDKVSRIYLKRYPATDEDSDYLSAVYVDGVRLQNQYLATQLPMPSTINDFWRMIAEFKVELILMLQPPDPDDPTCCAISPTSGEFKPTPYLNITAKTIVESEYYTSQKLLLLDNSEKPPREQSVTILCSTEWKPGRNQPAPPVMTMVTFWQAAERIARGDGPTVTLCHDGVTGCGLYLALSFLLERMAVERECDVCLAIRAVRRSRPDFVRALGHLEYLYDAALTYLEYFETYANFS